ncbi:MAG: hypothetical protein R6X08_02960 [Desulfosalsimonadaceae bacterium]
MVSAKRLVVMAALFSILLLPLSAAAAQNATTLQQPATASSGYITADIFAARPVGIASTVLGTAAFIVSSPFSALGGNFEHTFDEIVKKPFLYTFKRPLGVF